MPRFKVRYTREYNEFFIIDADDAESADNLSGDIVENWEESGHTVSSDVEQVAYDYES